MNSRNGDLPGAALRVLIVEDNEAQRRVLQDLLFHEGFHPVPCASAEEALHIVAEGPVAVAIIDYRLPDLSGTQLLERFDVDRRRIRAIIHTGYGSFESARDAVNLGAYAYVEKLGRPEDLIGHVHRAAQDWMTEELRRSKADYQHLLESVQGVVWRSRPDLRHNTFVSRQAEAMLGYPVEQWLQEEGFWEGHIHPDDRRRVVEECERLTAENLSHELEYRMLAADGRTVWVRDIINVLVEGDEPVEMVGLMVDITARKHMEQALRRSETHLRTILESEPECVKLLDREGLVLDMNAAGLAMVEADSLEQIQGQPVFSMIPPEHHAAYRALHERVFAGRPGTLSFEMTGHKGARRWVETHAVPLYDQEGEVEAYLAVTRDVTERRRADDTLLRRDAILLAVSFAAEQLLRRTSVGESMPRVLAQLGKASGASRAYLFQNHTDAEGLLRTSQRYEWTNEDTAPQIDNPELQNFSYEEGGYGRWSSILGRGGLIAGSVRDFPADEHTILEEQDIVSLAVVPILVEGGFWGFMGFDDCEHERVWSEPELEAIRAAANILGAALEKEHAEEALRSSEAHLRNAQRIARLGSWEHDLITRKPTLSDQTYEVFAFDKETYEPTFESFYQALHPDDRAAFDAMRAAALSGEMPYAIQLRIVRTDGETRVVRLRAEVTHDATGQPVLLSGTVHDVTEQVQAEAALHASEERLDSILRSLHDAVWSQDASTGRLLYMSPAVETIYGHPVQAFLDDPDLWKTLVFSEDRARVVRGDAADEGGAFSLEYRIVRPDGEIRWIHDRSHLVVDGAGTPLRRDGLISDITERKRAELAQRESEARNKALIQAIPDAMFRLSRDGIYREFIPAPRFAPLMPPEAFLGESIFFTHPEDVARASLATIGQALDTGALQVLEYQFEEDGERSYFEARIVPHGEDEVLAMVRDVTERHQAQEALHRSEARFRAIVENAPIGIFLTDERGLDLYDNAVHLEQIGMGPEQALGTGWQRALHPDDRERVLTSFQSVAQRQDLYDDTFRFLHQDGRVVWVRCIAAPLLDGDALLGYAGMVEDITERKRSEEALRQSEQRYRTLIEHAAEAIVVLDAETACFVDHNNKALELFGLSSKEMFRKGPIDMSPPFQPDGRASVELGWEEIRRAADGEARVFDWMHRDARGREIPCEIRLVRLPHADRVFVRGSITDISERKAAEVALRESEARLAEAQRIARMGHWDWDLEADSIQWSKESYRLFGLEQGVLEPEVDLFLQFVHPDDIDRIRERMASILQGHPPEGIQARIIRSDGQVRWVRVEGVVTHGADGQPLRMVGTLQDVTEQKQAEDALRESETRLELALRGGDLGLWDWDVQTGHVVFNERWAEMLGFTLGEIEPHLRTWERRVHPDDMPHVKQVLAAHLEDKTSFYETEHRLLTKQGSWKWILDRGKVVQRAPDGTPLRATGTHLDITERKQAEEALRASEEKFAKAFRSSPDAVTISRLDDGWFLDVNDGFERVTGYRRDEAVGKTSRELGFWQNEGRARMIETLEHDGRVRDVEMRLMMKGGEKRDCLVSAELIELKGERCLVAITHDVTERKRAEEALRQSETSFRLMFMHNPIPMWVFDSETLAFLDVNDAAVEKYGYTRQEFFSMTISDIRPQAEVPRFLEYIEGPLPALDGPEEWKHRTKDGRLLDVEITAHAFPYHERPARLVIANDVTERKRLQRELLVISGREQRRIGQDLHDGLGQLLTGIGFRVEELEGDLSRGGSDLAGDTAEIAELVEKAIVQTRALARGLNPVNVEEQGLAFALRELARSTERIYGIPCTYRCDEPVRVDDQEVANHVYRIAQEALNNAVKHARPTHLWLTLSQAQERTVLAVEDDGVGISAKKRQHEGMGLRIMDYRARMIGGRFEVQDRPARGTIATCYFRQEAVQPPTE